MGPEKPLQIQIHTGRMGPDNCCLRHHRLCRKPYAVCRKRAQMLDTHHLVRWRTDAEQVQFARPPRLRQLVRIELSKAVTSANFVIIASTRFPERESSLEHSRPIDSVVSCQSSKRE